MTPELTIRIRRLSSGSWAVELCFRESGQPDYVVTLTPDAAVAVASGLARAAAEAVRRGASAIVGVGDA